MPEFHSKVVGSSTAYRRINCPGSQELEARMPDQESVFALEGTGLHEIMEEVRCRQPMIPEDYLGEHINDAIPALNHEQVQALRWCYDIVDGLITLDDDVRLEEYLELPSIEGAGGTGDVVILHPDGSMTIVDYKFGRGVVVRATDVKGVTQLKFIACCARAKYGRCHSYHLHILQPRVEGGHTHVTVTDRDLDTFETQLIRALENRRKEYLVGDWCKFCKGEGVCPAKIDLAQQTHQQRVLEQEDLPRALSMVDELEDWCHAVRTLAHSTLENGGAIQGWKLVAKRAIRKWRVDEERITRKARRAGVRVKDYAPRKLVSPAQLEKLGVSVTEDMVEAKSSGTSLVRMDDPRPAVSSTVSDIDELSALLSSKRNGK